MTRRTFTNIQEAAQLMGPLYKAGVVATWTTRRAGGRVIVSYRGEGRSYRDLMVGETIA